MGRTLYGDKFSIEIIREYDNLEFDFPIFENSLIPKGKYWHTYLEFNNNTATNRDVYGEIEISTGNYYNGTRKDLFGEVVWVVNKHLSLNADYRHNIISLADDAFKTNEIGARIRYDFSTMVNSSVFTQWNNEQHELNFNYRFNWQPNIGSNFFVVVNHLISTKNVIKTKDIAVLIKLVWLFVL